MTSNFKRSINLVWLILSPGDFGPVWLMGGLSLYTFTMLMVTNVMSAVRNGSELLSKEWWLIVATCAFLVEILNQITYILAKRNRDATVKLKCIFFWLIFTGGIGTYIYLLSGLDRNVTWVWHEEIGYILIYIAFSWVFPIYSVSPTIRFLLLSDRFTKR